MEKKIHYVVGFAFSKDKSQVVLIKKNKPQWQKGFFNGVGGKVNEWIPRVETLTEVRKGYRETPREAMEREFKEETGVVLEYWHHFARLTFDNIILDCFRSFSDLIHDCHTIEEEEIVKMPVEFALHSGAVPIIDNLKVLIPMALDTSFGYADITSVNLNG